MASILIGLLSLPSIREHLEINHFPKWRFLHIGFTWILLFSLGFILHAKPVTSINIVFVAIVVFGVERLFSVTRHTRLAIPVGKAYGKFRELRVTPRLINGNGMAYWVEGRLVPVVQSTQQEDVLLADSLENRNSVMVEGPFGPNFGIIFWLYDLLITKQRRQHPAQIPIDDHLCFVSDSTGAFRSMSMQASYPEKQVYHLIPSKAPETKALEILLDKKIDEGFHPSVGLEEQLALYKERDPKERGLIVICGETEFRVKVEQWAAPLPTISR